MNEGQQKFLGFILDRVQAGKENEAKELLSESFQKQNDNTFNNEFLNSFIPRMISLLRPECISEVQSIMQQFSFQHTK